MKKYMELIDKCPLFADMTEAELSALLSCLSAREHQYAKNQFIFTAGSQVSVIGTVLSGAAHVIHEDFWGNRTILAAIGEGGMFGEAFTCAGVEKLPVSVVAVQPSEVLLIDYGKIINTCSAACAFHTRLIGNMLRILAGKNVMLTQKMEIMSRRTTREKLLSYLSAQAMQAGSNSFDIPFNRQELAEYLSVDRSAMSGELSRMQREGILTFRKSHFQLH